MTKSYKMEKIIGHRKHGHSHQYLIQWVGYSVSEATYEPEKNILDKDFLQKYQQKHNLLAKKASPAARKVKKPIKKVQQKKVQAKSSVSRRHVKKATTPKQTKSKRVTFKPKPKAKATANKVVQKGSVLKDQKELNKVLEKHHVSEIKSATKQKGQTLYTVVSGKNQCQINRTQLIKYGKTEQILKFLETLIK